MPDAFVKLTVNGKALSLSRSDVLRAAAEGGFGAVHQHVVEVNGEIYPVKEVFSRAANLDVLDFNTVQARSALRRLGFTLRKMA